MKINVIKHYKKCIKSKEKLREYYEKRGNEGAVDVIDKEIINMANKLVAAGGRL